MKIRPSQKKMILIILILGVVFVGVSLITPIYNLVNSKFDVKDIILSIILVVLSIVFSIVTYLRAYYLLGPKSITQQYIVKKKVYMYDDIAYIDDIRSRRSKTLVMYLNSGKQVLMAMDSAGKLLYEVSSRCTKLMSRSEFLKKHPNVRL